MFLVSYRETPVVRMVSTLILPWVLSTSRLRPLLGSPVRWSFWLDAKLLRNKRLTAVNRIYALPPRRVNAEGWCSAVDRVEKAIKSRAQREIPVARKELQVLESLVVGM